MPDHQVLFRLVPRMSVPMGLYVHHRLLGATVAPPCIQVASVVALDSTHVRVTFNNDLFDNPVLRFPEAYVITGLAGTSGHDPITIHVQPQNDPTPLFVDLTVEEMRTGVQNYNLRIHSLGEWLDVPFDGLGLAPTLLSAVADGPSGILVTFSEAMTENAELTDPTNYVLTADMGSTARTVTAVEVVDPSHVRLTLSGNMTQGTDNYLLEIDEVTDLAGNVINPAADSDDVSGPAPHAPIEIGREGGGPVTIFSSVAAGRYEVFVGPAGDSSDPQVYNGIPGSGGTLIEFDGTSGVGYLPPLPVGGPYDFTFVAEGGGPDVLSGQGVQVYPADFRARMLFLRRVLPPWYKTGIRYPENARFPQ